MANIFDNWQEKAEKQIEDISRLIKEPQHVLIMDNVREYREQSINKSCEDMKRELRELRSLEYRCRVNLWPTSKGRDKKFFEKALNYITVKETAVILALKERKQKEGEEP